MHPSLKQSPLGIYADRNGAFADLPTPEGR